MGREDDIWAFERGEEMSKPDHPIAWAWRFDSGLGAWTHAERDVLLLEGKPSPEAKPVCVRLVPNVEYQRLMRDKRCAAKILKAASGRSDK